MKDITFNVSISIDPKEGETPDAVVIESVNQVGKRSTQSYYERRFELLGSGFKKADIDSIKVNSEETNIDHIRIIKATILSDKRLIITVHIYLEQNKGCLFFLHSLLK